MLRNKEYAKIRIHGQVMVPQWNCIIRLAPQSKEIQMGTILIAILSGIFLVAVVMMVAVGAGAAVVAAFFKALCGSDD